MGAGASAAAAPLPPEVMAYATNDFAMYEPNRDMKADVLNMFKAVDMPTVLGVTEEPLKALLVDVEAMMSKHEAPYHSTIHVMDVTQYMFFLVHATNLKSLAGPRRTVTLLLAAIMHDLEHPGKSNVYQVNAKTELAIKYNNQSVLENHHADKADELLKKHGLFANLNAEDSADSFKVVRDMILSTDMSKHGEFMGAFKGGLGVEGAASDPAQQPLLYSLLIKVCDISNPARPQPIAHWWNEACYQEFYNEGDADKEAERAVNPLHDRINNVIPKSSVGFINFCVLPQMIILHDAIKAIAEDEKNAKYEINAAPVAALVEQLKANAANYGKVAEELAAAAAAAAPAPAP